MLSPGMLIGPYRVMEHVGTEGTTAEVYRAVDESDRTVAVKLLRAVGERVRLEAAAAARLNHPNIVRTYDVRMWDGRLCLIQEWVEGRSLKAVLDSVGRLDLAETVRVGHDIASALAHAHGLGILHRDIKPSNVLRTGEGEYKLVDFGAVGVLDLGTKHTRAGEIAGTPLYMSPEQAFGKPQKAASDLFGLGLLLFECFYGTVPGGSSGDFVQLITARMSAQIYVPRSPLKGLLDHCLDRDPALRPQSAAEVLDALSRIAPYRGPGWAQGAAPQGKPPATASDIVPSSPSDWEVPKPVPMSNARRSGVLAAVIVIVGGLLSAGLLAQTPTDVGFWVRLAAGVVCVGGALLVARWVRRLVGRAPETERQAASILTGAGGRDALTRSMVIEVDQVVAKLKGLDAKFLGYTMVMLIREAEEAKESADRVVALVQMVALMEKVMKQLSPWYVRHKEIIATFIAIVGSLVGVASVVSGFLR